MATTLSVALPALSKSIEIFGSVVVKVIGFPTSGVIVTRYFLAPLALVQVAFNVEAWIATSTLLGVSGLDLTVKAFKTSPVALVIV